MKKTFYLGLLLLYTTCLSAQIRYEKGYFIGTDNQKTECFIKNVDWLNNPTRFEYTLTENGEKKTQTIENVKEFAILNVSKYLKAEVLLDTSSSDVKNMSYNRFPETKKVTVLLKVLVEGGATLFYYEQPRIKDFFSKVADKPIEPLVYKQYINSSNQVKENMEFHHYLSVNLTCKDIGLPAIEKTGYKEKDLIQLYQKYNACINPNTVATTFDGQKQQKLNFKIVAQLNRNNLEFFSSFIPDGDVIANNIAPSIGFELERILPFNGNKWGIFVAPNYYAYKVTTNKAQYSALEIPVNVRYYMFLKNNNRIFLNAGVVLNKPFIKELQTDNQNTYKVGVRVGANGGIGYAFGKWAAELRYYKPLNIMDNYLQIYTKYNKASLVLSYRL